MTLCAITEPGVPGGKARIFDIITVNLRFRKDRIANICHLINLFPLFPILAGLVPFSVNELDIFDKYNKCCTSSLITCTETSIAVA